MSSEQASGPDGPFASDLALMREVAAGAAVARQDLVRRLLPRAQRLCHTLLRNGTDAKDASQSALLQVLRSVHTYRGECALEHWSDRIVSRTALRWMAAERRTRHEPLVEDTGVDGGGGHPRVLLRECLNRLSEPQRSTLLLRACFEYSIDEIATLTNVSRNTVKDRLLRARQTLRVLVRAPEGLPAIEEPGDSTTISAVPPARPPNR